MSGEHKNIAEAIHIAVNEQAEWLEAVFNAIKAVSDNEVPQPVKNSTVKSLATLGAYLSSDFANMLDCSTEEFRKAQGVAQ